jgi:hypothetical protein
MLIFINIKNFVNSKRNKTKAYYKMPWKETQFNKEKSFILSNFFTVQKKKLNIVQIMMMIA